MERKLIYRIELKTVDYMTAKAIAVAACLSNGGNYLSLSEMAGYGKGLIQEIGYKDMTLTVVNNCLLLDKGVQNLLTLTEVEILELEHPEISKQEATGILKELDQNDSQLN